MTVTSELHAQAERTQKQEREEKVTSGCTGGGLGKDRARDDGAYARGRPARGRARRPLYCALRGWPTT